MSVNRTIGVLLKDLGLKGDVDAITECLTEYFHDEQGLLEHQPSEEQLVRMGITLEVDRKKVLGLIAQNAKGKEKVEPEKVVGLPGATAKQYELDLDGDAVAGFLPLKYYLEGEKDEERSLSQISQLYAERRELIDAVFRELRVNGSAELPVLIAKLDNKFEFLSKPNRIGVSALYFAACTNAADAMVTLISTVGEKYFDFDFQAFEHKATALHVAAAFGFFRVCAVLLYFGASTTAVNANRKTARDEARVGGEALNVFEVYAKKGKSGLLREFPKLLGKLGDRKPLLRSLSKGKIAHATTKSPSQSQLQPVVLASTPHTSQPERQAIQFHATGGCGEPATATNKEQQLQATASSGGLSTNASGTSANLNRSGNASAMSAGMATNGLNDRSANSSAMTAGTRERDRDREKEAQLSPPSSNHNNATSTASSSSSTQQPAPSPRLSTTQKHQAPPTPLASQPSQLILFHAAGGVSDGATQGLDSNPALAATVNDSQFTVELCGFLTAAARNNNVDSMRQLLHSIDEELTMALCAFSPDGETPLIAAAKRGHLHIVQQLVSHKDVAAFIDLQAPPHSSTALHFACQNAHPDVCALLLIAGASSVSKNDKGLTCRSESKDDGIQFLFSIYDKFGIHGLKMTYFPSDEDLKTAAKSRRKSIGKEAKSVFSNATAMATSKSSSSTSGSAIPFGASGKAAGNFSHCAVSPTCVYTARGKEVRAPALMATPSSSTLMSNVLASTSALSQAVSGAENSQGPSNPLDVFEAERILSCVVVAHSSTKLKEFLNLLNYGTSTYCMIEQTLIRLIPFSTSSLFHTAALTNSFCAKSILNEPDLAIYLSQPQMEVSEMLKVVRAHKEFKKLPYLAVDMDGRKDTKGEALASLGQNYLGFEKAQSRTMRQELLVSRLSQMLWQGKRRVGVAIPPYFYTFWRSYSQDLRLTTRANVMAALHEAVFANSVKADAKSAVLLSTTAIYTVYFPDSRLKKSLNVAQITEKGLTAQTMTVKDLLVIVFKLQAADLDNSIIMSVNKTKIALTDSIECVAKSQFMLCILPNLSEQAIQKAIEKFGWVVVSDGTVTSDEDYVEVNVFTEFIKFLAALKPQTEASTNLTLTYEKIMEFCATIHGAKAGTVFRALRNFGYFYLNKYASVYVVPSLVMNQPERTQLLLDFENSKRERKFNRYFLFSDRPYSGYFAQIYAGLNTTFSKLLSYCWISNSNTTMSFILYKLNDNSSLLITLDAHLIFVNYSGISNDQLFFFQVTHAIRVLAKNINPSLIAEELVACSECLKNANASAANNNSSNNGDHLLFLSELFQFNRPGKNATAFYVCEHTQATLSLDALVPDFEVPVTTFDNRPMKTLKKIGQGAFGVVTRCELEDGSSVAVKSFRLDQADGPCAMSFEVFQLFQREALLASRLSSDYILRQMGIIQREYCLVQEFAPHGVLGDVLYSDQALPIRLRNKFCQDIALGLKYLHGLKPAIIHRDLRSYNIFVMSLELPASTTGGGARPVNAKIGDFGLSVQSTLVPLREPLESWQWLAPEIIAGSNYTEQSDIYSFGIIAYEIYSRVLPFTNVSSILHTIKMPVGHMGEEELEALRAAGYEIEDSQAVKVEFKTLDAKEFIVKEGLRPLVTGQYFEEGSELVKLLEHCWQTSPHGRPTAPDLCELVETLPDVEPSQKFLWRTTKGVSLTNYRKIGRSGKSQKQLEVQLLEQGRRATRVLAEDDAFLEFQRRQSSYRKPTPSQPSLTLERVADDAANGTAGTGGGESKSSERTGKKYRRAGRALDPSDDDQAMRKSGDGELSSDGLSLEYSGGEAVQTDSSGALHSSTGSALSVGGSPNRSEHVASGEEESKWARLIPLLPTLPTIPVPNQAGSGQPSPNERAKDQEEVKLQQFIQAYTQRRMTVQNLLIPVPHSTDGDSASHSPSSNNNKERRYDLASAGLAASQGKSLKERKRDKALSTSRSNNDVTATRAREASVAGNGGEGLTRKSKSPKRANADEQPQEKLEKARSRRKSKSPNRGLNSNSNLVESLSTGNLLSVGDGSECVEKENRPDRDRSREEQREREKERRSSANAKLFVQAKRTKSSSRGGEERESRVELGQRSEKARSVQCEAGGELSAHVQSDRGNSRDSLVSSLQHLPTTANNSLARLNAKDPLKASDDMAIVMSPKINPASLSLSSGSSTSSDKGVTSLARQSSHERNFQRRCSSPAFSGAMSARGSKPNSADASSTTALLDSGANSQSASSTASSSSNAEATTTTKNTSPNSSQKKEAKETATFLQTSVSERAGLRTMPLLANAPPAWLRAPGGRLCHWKKSERGLISTIESVSCIEGLRPVNFLIQIFECLSVSDQSWLTFFNVIFRRKPVVHIRAFIRKTHF